MVVAPCDDRRERRRGRLSLNPAEGTARGAAGRGPPRDITERTRGPAVRPRSRDTGAPRSAKLSRQRPRCSFAASRSPRRPASSARSRRVTATSKLASIGAERLERLAQGWRSSSLAVTAARPCSAHPACRPGWAGAGRRPSVLKPDLAAPGRGVVSSVPGGGWASQSGTSMAAPHVAGTIALLRQADRGIRARTGGTPRDLGDRGGAGPHQPAGSHLRRGERRRAAGRAAGRRPRAGCRGRSPRARARAQARAPHRGVCRTRPPRRRPRRSATRPGDDRSRATPAAAGGSPRGPARDRLPGPRRGRGGRRGRQVPVGAGQRGPQHTGRPGGVAHVHRARACPPCGCPSASPGCSGGSTGATGPPRGSFGFCPPTRGSRPSSRSPLPACDPRAVSSVSGATGAGRSSSRSRPRAAATSWRTGTVG